jgi:hypothetical protein
VVVVVGGCLLLGTAATCFAAAVASVKGLPKSLVALPDAAACAGRNIGFMAPFRFMDLFAVCALLDAEMRWWTRREGNNE